VKSVARGLAVAFALLAPGAAFAADAVPAPLPSPSGPVYGDLSHLEYTATGDLSVTLVAPQPGGASDRAAATFDISTVAGAGVELQVDGTVVETKRIGKRTIDKKTGETHYFYYGVALAPGPNDILITPLGAGGLRGTPVRASVFGPGIPVRVEAKMIGTLRADGRTPAIFELHGIDRWSHPALPGSTVHVAIVKGDAHFESLQRKRTSTVASALPPGPGATSAPVSDLLANAVASNPAGQPADPADPGADLDAAGDDVPAQTQQGQDLNFRAIGDRSSQFASLDVVLLAHGSATLALVPGLQPGDLLIRTTIAGTQNDVRAFISPALRKPMLVGLATAGVGSVPGVPGESADAPEDANSRKGRVALYGVGRVGRNVQATIAYDTADTLDLNDNYGTFVDDPTTRPYQTYGDSSVMRDDALSRDHLYARIDDNRSSAMWGEFQADTGSTSGVGGFSQLVDGAKVEIAGNNAKLSGFQARNDIAYARQIFSPTGLSNLGGLLHPDIVVGSDTVTLVALDRRTGAILSQTVLTRNVDYTLDYGSGFLRFINPPLPFDTFFNPQQILIAYEYGNAGANAQTTGGRFETAFGSAQAVRLGAGYVNDATGSGNFSLANQDLTGALPGGAWSIGHISAHGALPGSSLEGTQAGATDLADGDAYEFALTTALGTSKVDLGFQTTSQGFNNPFGGLSTPGLLDYHATYTHPFAHAGSVTLGFDHEQNNLPGASNAQSSATLHARLPLSSRITATAGVDIRTSSAYAAPADSTVSASSAVTSQQAGTTTTSASAVPALPAYTSNGAGSAQAEAGVEYKVNRVVGLSANRISNLGQSQNASQPAETTVEADVSIAKHGRVFIRQLWADAPTTSFAAATATLTGVAGAKTSTAIGVEKAVGASTDVDTEYVIDRTASGSDAYAEMGVREKLNIAKNLNGEASFQRATTFGVTPGDFEGSAATQAQAAAAGEGYDIYGLSLAYSIARFHAAGQYQLRNGSNRGYTLDLSAAGALSPDFSAFVSSNSSSSSAGFNTVDAKATLAYRPSSNDRGVTLFSYERLDGNVTTLGSHAEILSLEELYRPATWTEIAARYAYKLDGDAYYPARSSLFGLRLDQRLSKRFDVAAETRFLSAHEIVDARTTGVAVEGGYRIGNDLRVAGGYNFTGSPDPSLAAAPTRKGVYATVTSVIDSVFGWGK